MTGQALGRQVLKRQDLKRQNLERQNLKRQVLERFALPCRAAVRAPDLAHPQQPAAVPAAAPDFQPRTLAGARSRPAEPIAP